MYKEPLISKEGNAVVATHVEQKIKKVATELNKCHMANSEIFKGK